MNRQTCVALQGCTFSRNFGDLLLQNLFFDLLKEAGANRITVPIIKKAAVDQMKFDAAGFSSLSKARCIVFHGGGYFGAPSDHDNRWNARQMERYAPLIRHLLSENLPTAVLGVGVGPFPPGPFTDMTRALFSHAEIVAVRDDFSAENAASLLPRRYEVLPDAALSLPSLTEYAEETADQRILLHLTGKLSCEKNMEITLAGLEKSGVRGSLFLTSDKNSKYWRARDRLFDVIDISGDNEWRRALGYMRSRNKPFEILGLDSVPQMIEAISRASLVITSKLHLGLVALAYGKPVVAIPDHVKTINMYNYLGFGDLILPHSKMTDEALSRKIQWALSKDIKEKSLNHTRSTGKYFTLLQEFLGT